MEETTQIDPDFLKGFNDGYLIAQYEPELAEKLSKIEAVSPRIVGMQQGREQFIKEQLKDKLPNWLKDNPIPDRTNTLSKDQNKQIDKE
ncbi:hypothetical protein [Emticicia sp. BO119]|uniref:hypothetical protein n=1 Tax=Emticicia sp. BO119 TaxID=2757768 RepID=UPI0015F044F8|nr:hypothetical protein [Emticicia sp. BO119]MBA4853749.1 hypothetical protein [Emticicia sp. BO119]